MSAAVDGTARGELGAILSNGSLHRFTPVDLPMVPASSIAFSAGVKLTDYIGIADPKIRVVGIVRLEDEEPIGVFTEHGVVKRVVLTELPAKPDLEVISLKAGDRVVGAFPAPDGSEFAVVASDAQLLRFPAASVRPQGRGAGGMAGMKLGAEARVVFAGAVAEGAEAKVVTVADSSITLPGTDVATAKVSDWAEFPAKGRATGGVRAQRFLKWEDQIACAWVGTEEPRALAADGRALALPSELGRRDGSGYPLDGAAAYVAAAP